MNKQEIEARIKALEAEYEKLGDDVSENLLTIIALKWALGEGDK